MGALDVHLAALLDAQDAQDALALALDALVPAPMAARLDARLVAQDAKEAVDLIVQEGV